MGLPGEDLVLHRTAVDPDMFLVLVPYGTEDKKAACLTLHIDAIHDCFGPEQSAIVRLIPPGESRSVKLTMFLVEPGA